MQRMRNHAGSRREAVYAYAITFMCVLFTFWLTGIYPFGSYTLLKMDMLHAYAPDFLEIRRALAEDGWALYSWGGMLGRNLLNCAMTIMSSPFNLLTALFPDWYQADFFSILTLLKIPCAAAGFCVYAKKRLHCGGTGVVCLSVSYALCSYVTVFHFNIMWLDTVIVLPLVFLGIDRLLDEDDARLYLAALAYAIFTSYGTAFQLCFFCGLYLLCGCVLRRRYCVRFFLRFAASSLLAAGLCAVTLFVVADSFDNTQYFHEKMPELALNFSPLRFFAAHFFGSFPSVRFYSDSAPNVYCGVLALVLTLLFLGSRQISFREKLAWFVFTGAAALCFLISTATYVLHGLHFPVMFPHRYSYVYSFALLAAAARAYSDRQRISRKTAFLLAAGLCLLVISLFLLMPQHDAASVSLCEKLFPGGENAVGPPVPGRVSLASLERNIVLICVYTALLWAGGAVTKPPASKVMGGLLLICVCAEAVSGGANGIGYLREVERSWFNQELYDDMHAVTARLNEEPELYRAEFYRNRSQSDGRVYGYNGFSGLNATSGGYSDGLERLLQCLGMSSSFNNLVWQDPSPVVSSLFAQKYLLDAGTIASGSTTAFCYRESIGGIDVYENPHVLPVGFAVPSDIGTWMPDENADPFDMQNALFGSMSGQPDVWDGVEPILIQAENLDLSYGEKTGEYIFELPDYLSYEDLVSGILPRAVIRYAPDEDGFLSFCVRGVSVSRAVARINGKTVSSLSVPWGNTSLNAGFVEAGDAVEIVLDLDSIPDGEEREMVRQGVLTVYAARLDMDLYEQGVARLRKQDFEVGKYDRTHIEGTITCDEECLLWTSIPYDHNWHVVVDGEAVQMDRWGDALMSVTLSPGDHSIEFEYRMDNLPIAACVSAVSAIFAMMLYWREAKRHGIGSGKCDKKQAARGKGHIWRGTYEL